MDSIRQQIEQQFPGLPFHESVATFLVGQWSRVTIHDPATYIRSMARVLSQYRDPVVLACADPANGIALSDAKLPTMKTLNDWLQREDARQATIAQHAASPKVDPEKTRVVLPPLKIGPTLFVPENVPPYARMVEKHNETGGTESYYERRVCRFDGVTRNGLWVPPAWIEPSKRTIASTWMRPPAKEIIEEIGL